MDLTRFLGTLVRWSWLILTFGVLAGVVGYAVTSAQPRQYTSRAMVLVGSLTGTDLQQQLAFQQLARTYATMATTTPVLEQVRAGLGSHEDLERLESRLVVRTPPDQSFVQVSATAPSATDAAALANAVAEQVTLMSRSATGRTALADVVQPALVPTEPSSPNVMLNTAIAVLLGLLVGLGSALALSEWNRSRRVQRTAPQGMAPYPW